MSERPADPPAAARPVAPAGPGDAPLDADASAVLGKLDALLGRLRGPEAPATLPLAQDEIPTLTEPVLWLSPAPLDDTSTARGRIPTLTEPVELRVDAAATSAPLAAPATARLLPDPFPLSAAEATVPVATDAPPADAPPADAPPADAPPAEAPPAEAAAARTPFAGSPPAAPTAARAPAAEAAAAALPLALSPDELRTLVEELVDPELEARLYEQALEGLEHTLDQTRRRLQSELDDWREAESVRLREQVRSEIARAVDAAVEELVQQQIDSRR